MDAGVEARAAYSAIAPSVMGNMESLSRRLERGNAEPIWMGLLEGRTIWIGLAGEVGSGVSSASKATVERSSSKSSSSMPSILGALGGSVSERDRCALGVRSFARGERAGGTTDGSGSK